MSSRTMKYVTQPPPEEIKCHFLSTPWASRLFSDPTLQPFTNEARTLNPTTAGDSLFARTLATDDTIIAWQSFYKPASPGVNHGEILSLVSLGSGVNGHVDICHGGFVSLVLDEVMGVMTDHHRPPNNPPMTAYLNVNYKKPVSTPGVILCRAWIEKTEGRKLYVRATVEDGKGTVMATGEALFILVEKVLPGEKL